MNEVPTVAEHLKKLAQNYHDIHLTLQSRYQEINSKEGFLMELRQREAALLNRFRLVQQQLLNTLKEEELERVLELSRVFDEIRIISQFVVQTLTAPTEPTDDRVGEK